MRKNLAANFGKNLRAARVRLGLTQREVAKEVGLALEAYGRLERGLALPRAGTLAALASLLGVTTDALLGLSARRTETVLDRVGRPKAGYVEGLRPELRRLLRMLERMDGPTLKLFVRLASRLESGRGAKRRR